MKMKMDITLTFGGKGRLSIHWTEFICVSIDKSYFGLRSVISNLRSSEIAPMESESDNLKERTLHNVIFHYSILFTIYH